ncbi:polyprenyl synthetase family protein [Candidatus Gottesmanbacteria bacterium]|nr:polyprenyl synthetase family protein [Candidatus Gottesmanbacteria bacterium]
MNLLELMQETKQDVDSALSKFFQKKYQEAEHIHPSTMALVRQISELTLRGGKRTRPFLCWVGYQAITNDKWQMMHEIPDKLLHAMVGLELFQTFALIHDDIIDESPQRRGGPAVHERFRLSSASCQLSAKNAKHYGESMALLAGDLALAWADEEITISKKVKNNELLRIYQKMKEGVIFGQTLDVMRESGASDISKERVDELKTAWYSVVRPLQMGSSLAAGVTPKYMRFWEAWGVPVGMLFQLRDDFLDGAVDEASFVKKAEVLQKKAHRVMDGAAIADDAMALLSDIVQFVSTRKS